MNLKKIIETLRAAKHSAVTYETRELAESFEEFLSLYNQKDVLKSDPDYLKKVQDSYKRVWDRFEKTASAHGLSIEGVKDYFNNKNNFSSIQWNTLQSLKQGLEIEEQKEEQPPQTAPVKKLRKNKNRIRI